MPNYCDHFFMNKFDIKIVKDVKQAERLWGSWSKDEEYWDLWSFRKIFIDIYKNPLYFVHAKRDGKTVGVLPLWFDKKKKHYEWVGGWYAEKSCPFYSDKEVIKDMLKSVNGTLRLEAMTAETASILPVMAERDQDHFSLDLKTIGYSWEGYLKTLKRKKRYNLARDIKRINQLRPFVRYDHQEDLEEMFRLNIERMDKKSKIYSDEESSVFVDEEFKQAIREIYRQQGKHYKARIISILVDNRVVAVDLTVIYKNKYYAIVGGLDVERVSGIGTYINMLDIKDAVEQGCDLVDYCMEDHHWKHSWFKPTPRYKLICENPAVVFGGN